MSMLSKLLPAPEEVSLGSSGDDLGRRVGVAVRDFVRLQFEEIAKAVPQWEPSLQHVADYCRQQVSALGGRVTALDAKLEQLANDVRNLQALYAHHREVEHAPGDA